MSEPEDEITHLRDTIHRLTAEISRLNAEIRGYKHLLAEPRVVYRASDREVEILQLLAQGLDKSAVADEVGLTVNTVKTHVYRVAQRWGARNTTHVIAIAKDEGII